MTRASGCVAAVFAAVLAWGGPAAAQVTTAPAKAGPVTAKIKNDLLVDFGPAGLWERLNDSLWQRINPRSPVAMAAGDLDGNGKDDVIASFAGIGLQVQYNNSGNWIRLHNYVPTKLVVADLDGNQKDDLIIDFGSSGLWILYNNKVWSQLNGQSSERLAVGDIDGNGLDDILVDFGAKGLWVRANNATWSQLNTISPNDMTTGDLDGDGKDDVVVVLPYSDSGTGGIWLYSENAGWLHYNTLMVQHIATGDLYGKGKDNLIYSSEDFGIIVVLDIVSHEFDWILRRERGTVPEDLLTTDLDGNRTDDLVADLSTSGLYAFYYNGSNKINNGNVEGLAAGAFD